MISAISIFLSAVVVSLLITFPVVWLLTNFKVGQPVRVEGPASHQAKSGTPTMGGIGFILTIIAFTLVFIDFDLYPKFLALVLLVLAYALIGLADDLLKIFRKENLGLTFWQKIWLQVIAAGCFALFMALTGNNMVSGTILQKLGIYSPFIYPLFVTFIIVGSANATNLTDGLNGLLAGTAGIAFLAFALIAGRTGQPEALTFSLICSGAVLAFLYFNFPKAKVFMGDIGSLAIGAALAGLAVILHRELRLAVIGGIFVIEALSVMIQVGGYKLFKKRLFRMSPIHHHFELLGLKEWIVVIGFWVVALVLGIAGVLL
ncbi:MAG: phospho-N-acetylmuramoyl-pentapeptide-transferase [Candidatus Margulisbacteria bacterium]|nr:phospho-N-acetylmuramoyl-pentapeptide-transferase [Candidatus Margulisiibacteriota bacterium]